MLTWRIPTQQRRVYLTFDDGPTPGVTDAVLAELATAGAQATFFVIGQHLERHPELAAAARTAGHTLANHTWTHPNGWASAAAPYLDEVRRTQALLEAADAQPSRWFRPPYGKLNPLHVPGLRRLRLGIAMWSALAWDWDAGWTADRCLARLWQGVRPGSILVLHDSAKAAPRMLPLLPRLLARLHAEGYTVHALPAHG